MAQYCMGSLSAFMYPPPRVCIHVSWDDCLHSCILGSFMYPGISGMHCVCIHVSSATCQVAAGRFKSAHWTKDLGPRPRPTYSPHGPRHLSKYSLYLKPKPWTHEHDEHDEHVDVATAGRSTYRVPRVYPDLKYKIPHERMSCAPQMPFQMPQLTHVGSTNSHSQTSQHHMQREFRVQFVTKT